MQDYDQPHQIRLLQHVRPQRLSLLTRLWQSEQESDRAADAVAASLLRKARHRIQDCMLHPLLMRDNATGELITTRGRCNSRLCPHCARCRGRELEARVLEHVRRLDSPRFMTLTLRCSRSETLPDAMRRMMEAFRRLRRTREWREHVTGGIYAVEVTWSRRTQSWHPHLHCLIDGKYWPQKAISLLWLEETGNSSIVDIRRVNSQRQAAAYIGKYAAKGSDMPADMPLLRVAEWVAAFRGLRLCQCFGSMHGSRLREPKEPRPDGMTQLIHLGMVYDHAAKGDRTARRLWNYALTLRRQTKPLRHARIARMLDLWRDKIAHRPPPTPPKERREEPPTLLYTPEVHQ